MTKKLVLISLVLGTILFTGCGSSDSSSSDNTFTGTITKNGVKHTCNTEVAYNACKDGDCSSCTNDAPTAAPVQNTACTVSGNTVLVNEGTTCTNGNDTLSCQDNKVTLNNSITGGTININGKTYTCQ